MRRIFAYGPSLVVLATVTLTLLVGPVAVRRLSAARISAVVMLAQQRLDDDDLLERINQATRDIAAAVEPSVVFIRGVIPGPLGRFGQSTGSGWVFDDQGHIVTNAHVVTGAADVRVQFYDGRVRKASLVGMDRSTDIAVLKISDEADMLFPSRRASGEPVHQGDRVFAFGSPFGFKFSMSGGIVSGLGRNAQSAAGPSAYTNFIQTDAAINPGNSGGPLVDVNGRVIGMNTAIITSDDRSTKGGEVTGISGGIGFAIPLETLESVVGQLIKHGIVLKGYLGVSLGDLAPEAAEREGYTRGWGVVVASVQENMPAKRSGLEPGDIIYEVDGRPTRTVQVLRSMISNRLPGEEIAIKYWRLGAERSTQVTLAAARVTARGQLAVVDPQGDLKAAIAHEHELDQIVERVARFGVIAWEPVRSGLRVQAVRPGSMAANAGFRPGQIVVDINGTRVFNADGFFRAVLEASKSADQEANVDVVDPRGRELRLRMRLEQI